MAKEGVLRSGLFLVPNPHFEILSNFITAAGISCIPRGKDLYEARKQYHRMPGLNAHVAMLGLIENPQDTVRLLDLIGELAVKSNFAISTVGLVSQELLGNEIATKFDITIPWSLSCVPVVINSVKEQVKKYQ